MGIHQQISSGVFTHYQPCQPAGILAPGETADVTLLMPCLNETRTLPQCIQEGQQALAQLCTEDGLTGEILVADNGSTDGSVELRNEN